MYCLSKEHLTVQHEESYVAAGFQKRQRWLANILSLARWNADQAACLPFFSVTESKLFMLLSSLELPDCLCTLEQDPGSSYRINVHRLSPKWAEVVQNTSTVCPEEV